MKAAYANASALCDDYGGNESARPHLRDYRLERNGSAREDEIAFLKPRWCEPEQLINSRVVPLT